MAQFDIDQPKKNWFCGGCKEFIDGEQPCDGCGSPSPYNRDDSYIPW